MIEDQYLHIVPKELEVPKFHQYLLGSIGPRPICFASTVDAKGNVNLSPFSFFNVFGANPPILIFSPARRVRGNTTKHSLENAKETREVVINIVNHPMVQQMSLSSTEYEKGVNEFIKAGLTMMESDIVKPPRVAESPVQLECRVKEIVETGTEGGAGNLVICEVLKMHINRSVLNEEDHIDQYKIDLVARMGGNWYSRAREGMFEVAKPIRTKGIGVDALPNNIRLSSILSGNDLGQLGNVEQIPSLEEAQSFLQSQKDLSEILESHSGDTESLRKRLHNMASGLLEEGNVDAAWKVLIISEDSRKE